jgi:hypothetical protein
VAIPQDPDDISAPWLTAALQASAPGVTVTSVEVGNAGDATNYNATLHLAHDAGDRLPATLFLKIPPIDPIRRERLDWRSMGEREVRFYRDLAPRLDFRTPQIYAAELDEATGEFLLLMEHLDASGCALPDWVSGVEPSLAEQAMTEFAQLHVRFEKEENRRRQAFWLRPSGRTSDYGARLLRDGLDSGLPLGGGFIAVAERYIAERDVLQDAWELGPSTVLHGDAHIGNVFVDPSGAGPRLGFYDWGLMTLGSPMRDVSYFLAMTLSPENRAAHEAKLIQTYLDARELLGGTEITFDDAWFWHRLQVAYTVVASCQAVAVPPDASDGRRAFAAAFVERAARAVDELDSVAALDAFAS